MSVTEQQSPGKVKEALTVFVYFKCHVCTGKVRQAFTYPNDKSNKLQLNNLTVFEGKFNAKCSLLLDLFMYQQYVYQINNYARFTDLALQE